MSLVELSLSSTAALCDKLKVLSDENRMKIILLLRQGERCVCDIVDALDLPQSLISHHLATLRGAGLLRDRRSGKWVYYSINKENVAELGDLFSQLFDPAEISIEPAPDCGPERCCGA